MRYISVKCRDCRFAEEVEIHHLDGTSRIYICHNEKSKEFGRVHADFYECRLKDDPGH